MRRPGGTVARSGQRARTQAQRLLACVEVGAGLKAVTCRVVDAEPVLRRVHSSGLVYFLSESFHPLFQGFYYYLWVQGDGNFHFSGDARLADQHRTRLTDWLQTQEGGTG